MTFVYIHAVAFDVDAGVRDERLPTSTLIVSTEAIFLSTFVMIGQNRAVAFQQAKAGYQARGQFKSSQDSWR